MATFTVEQLLNPPAYTVVKENIYDELIAAGFTAMRSNGLVGSRIA